MSDSAIIAAPAKAIIKPTRAFFEGFTLNMKDEMSIENIGVVFTRTVAFSIVVSFTADMKKTK